MYVCMWRRYVTGFTVFPIQSDLEPGLFLLRVALAYRRIASLDWYTSHLVLVISIAGKFHPCYPDPTNPVEIKLKVPMFSSLLW